ncbi:Uncharacterized protein ALO35_00684 [Pseudomonas amygdali pv. lachrymans]|uniref:Uncharacterized protein n=1 Tax=Pseudomonas amygdali pv. lachrymans TaxID=53707 RepID=A0A0P9TKX0_PSEAV|nr:Uncharacterized protein ALO35_00684 [Pseudomonas amygdali pv. lachrymans]
MLHIATGTFLRLTHVFPQQPQRLTLRQALGDQRISQQTLLDRITEHRFKRFTGVFLAAVIRQFQQREPGLRCVTKRLRPLRELLTQQRKTIGAEQLESRQPSAKAGAGVRQKGNRIGQGVKRQKGNCLSLGQRKKLQRRSGDDTQRAFAANEQIPQVITGIVLAQTTQAIPYFALGGNHLKPQRQLAHVAVAQHRIASCVGAQVAPDSATALRAQAQRKQTIRLPGCILQILQDAARFDRQGVIVSVDFAHLIHAIQQQQHRPTTGVGCRSAHQTGITALHHHRR